RDARAAGDAQLMDLFYLVINSDMVAYQYVTWHTFAYQYLARLRSDIDGVVSAFDHDDTHHTGRAEAELEARLLKALIDNLATESTGKLSALMIQGRQSGAVPRSGV